MGPHESLVYETPMDSGEDLLVWITAVTNVGLQGICDRVYQNMVLRHHVCVQVTGRHIENFL